MMNALAYKPALNDEDRLAAAHAMLLQDRIDEAIALFETVQADAVAERVQYDYLQAYVAFYREAPGLAREIADRHLTHPVDRWREMFAEIDRQVEEIEGATRSDLMDGAQDQQQLASTEPNFDFRIEGGRAIVESRNLDELHVNYYLMDLELLFSRNPFELASAERFSSIRPNAEETRRLFAGERTLTFDLPQEFRNRNVLVEIMAGGSRKSQVAFANALAVQVIENYGQTLVTHQTTGRPLARVYCKVYARMADGSTRFYKDGYTDLRGRFDYASLSTDELDRVTRFAILIADAERGSTIREAAPPKR
jgi:hypothetical protein